MRAGLLGGVIEKENQGRRAGEGVQKQLEKNRDKIEAWESLCRELGEKPADVAIAWMLQNPAISAPIIGPRTQEQLEGQIRSLEITLTEETNNKLNEIFPGKKTAPKITPGDRRLYVSVSFMSSREHHAAYRLENL